MFLLIAAGSTWSSAPRCLCSGSRAGTSSSVATTMPSSSQLSVLLPARNSWLAHGFVLLIAPWVSTPFLSCPFLFPVSVSHSSCRLVAVCGIGAGHIQISLLADVLVSQSRFRVCRWEFVKWLGHAHLSSPGFGWLCSWFAKSFEDTSSPPSPSSSLGSRSSARTAWPVQMQALRGGQPTRNRVGQVCDFYLSSRTHVLIVP